MASDRCGPTTRTRLSLVLALGLLFAAGCNNSGGGGGPTVDAPTALSYPIPDPWMVGVAITPLSPTVLGGSATSYSVTPALPAGIVFDSATGDIAGTPSATSPETDYTFRATNSAGSAETILSLAVFPQPPCAVIYLDPDPTYTAGTPIVPNTVAVGCGGADTFTIDPPLPAGLLLDGATGTITGTPGDETAAAAYVVTAANDGGSDTSVLTITVLPEAPCGLAYAVPVAEYFVGVPIVPNVPTVGCGAVADWSVSPPLPTGLVLDPATGTISGTPTAVAPMAVHTVTAENAGGSDSADVMITVLPLAPAGLAYATPDATYPEGQSITPNIPSSTGGPIGGYTVDPPLPTGLGLDPGTGIIDGTPTVVGGPTVHTVTATNAGGSDTATVTITVTPAPPTGLVYSEPVVTYTVGVMIVPNTPTSTGGPVDDYAVAPSLPAGLMLDPSTGVISGTPTFLGGPTVHTVTASNAGGTDTATVTITVGPSAPAGLTYPTIDATYTVGATIVPNVPSSSGGPIDGYAVDPPLPSGLSIDPMSGVISGTPLAAGATASHVVTATNASGSDTVTLTITVLLAPPAGLGYSDPDPTYTQGTAIPTNVPTSSGGPIDGYTVDPALPAGLQIDAMNGEITGTPTEAGGPTVHTVTATNASGSDTTTVTIAVDPQGPAGLTYTTLDATYSVNTPIAENTPSSTGGPIDSYSVSPPLPSGLDLDTVSGVISGTPQVASAAASHVVTASNGAGTDTVTLTITVLPEPPTGLVYSEPSAVYPFGAMITPNTPSSVGGPVDSYSIVPPLPTGLQFDTGTGAISGTPTVAAGPTVHTVTATNAGGSDTATVTIRVLPEPPATLTYTDPAPIYPVGSPIPQNVATVTGGAPLSFSAIPPLPVGFTLDSNDGTLTGTPQNLLAPKMFTIIAANDGGFVATSLLIEIVDPVPCNLAYPSDVLDLVVGQPLAAQVPTVGCGGADSFSIDPSLPAGLTFDPASGTIAGTPTAVAPTTVHTVTATNASGTDTATVTIGVALDAPCDLVYGVATIDAVVGTPVTPATPTVGCGAVATWAIDPPLPAGLTLDPADGTISGTPTAQAPAVAHTVTAANGAGADDTTITISVAPAAPAGLTYDDLAPVYSVGMPITPNLPSAGGGPIDDYSVDPPLPAGLMLDATSGVITGTPLAISAASDHTVTASNLSGSDTVTLTITVLPEAPAGLGYSQPTPTYLQGLLITPNTPSSTGGPVDGYSVDPPLPAGLALAPDTGVITGTPTTLGGPTAHTVTATNAGGTDTAVVEITVAPQAPAGLTYDLLDATYNVATPITVNTPSSTGGPITGYAVDPPLPLGLGIDPTSGEISGTPEEVSATASYVVTGTNVTDSTMVTLTITVLPEAPFDLAYSEPSPTYLLGIPIAANTPSADGGAVDEYTVDPPLPAGLLLDPITGAITGTPTVLGGPNLHTVTATNAGGSDSAVVSITVDPQAPDGLSYDVLDATYTVGTPIAVNTPSSTGGEIAVYSVDPPLPLGLGLDLSNGEISGTPREAAATASYTVTATNVTGFDEVTLTITVLPIAPAGLEYAVPTANYPVGTPIPANAPSSSGGPIDEYDVSPPLPLGLELDPGTGVIDGTPTVVGGPMLHTVTATNAAGSDSAVVTITIDPQAPIGLTYDVLDATYTVGTPITVNTPSSTGGAIDSYSVDPPLPAGLQLDGVNGWISGTPQMAVATADHVVTGTNATGSAEVTLTITVLPEAPSDLVYSEATPTYTQGQSITPNTPTSSGGSVDSYAIDPPLPSGLLLDTSSGAITGTPFDVGGPTDHTVTATNAGGSDTAVVSITIDPQAPAGLTYDVLDATYTVGTPITVNTPSSTGGAIAGYSVDPSLPTGLGLDPITGDISGTPTAATATASYVVTGTNVTDSTMVTLTITVLPEAPFDLAYSELSPTYLLDLPIAANTPSANGGAVDEYTVDPPLPAGLLLDSISGVITGTPTVLGGPTLHTVTATNAGGSDNVVVSITVDPQAPAGLTYDVLDATYDVGVPIAANTPSSTGGAIDGYSVDPPLPMGLELDPVTGEISGTPTAATATSSYVVTGTNVTDSTMVTLTITVLPEAPTDLAYSEATPSYLLDLPIPANTPSANGGAVDEYTVDPPLPAGLLLDSISGAITGTPTVIGGPTDHTVTATNAGGSDTTVVSITVVPQAPAGLTYDLLDATYTVGTPITVNSPSSNGGAIAGYAVDPPLPLGLGLDPLSGEISGTPQEVTATASYVVTATNVTGSTTVTLTITVHPEAPSGLTYSDMMPTYTEGVAIPANTPMASGGPIDGYSVDPPLPAGLLLDPSSGEISGTPLDETATASYVVTATNVTDDTTATLTITVEAAPAPTLAYSDEDALYSVDVPITENIATVTGFTPTNFTAFPSLPVGLTLAPTTGTISGIPTVASGRTAHTITAAGGSDTANTVIHIEVEDPAPCDLVYPETSVTLPVGSPLVALVPTVGCGGADEYTVTPDLPTGISIDASTGTIAGTPTEVTAPTVHTVTASNAFGMATFDLTLEVETLAPCEITYSAESFVFAPGVMVAPEMPAVGCGGADEFSVDPPLPAGLLLDTSTGAISGMPTAETPPEWYEITATNADGSDVVEIEIAVDLVFTFTGEDLVVPYDPADGDAIFEMHLSYQEDAANPGFPHEAQGLQVALAYDPTYLGSGMAEPGIDLMGLNGSTGPSYFGPMDTGTGITVGIIFDFDTVETVVADVPREVVIVTFTTNAANLVGDTTGVTFSLPWEDDPGSNPPISNLVVLDGNGGIVPVRVVPTIELVPTSP